MFKKTRKKEKKVVFHYLETVYFKHVSPEALTTGRMIPLGTTSPPAEVSTQ
jgi:hypothetical protein